MNIGRLVDWFIHKKYFENATELRKARLLVRASLLTSIFSTSYVALSVFFEYERGIYFTLFNVVGYFALPFLCKTKIPFRILGFTYNAIGSITVIVLTWFSGGMWSAIYPWIIAIPLLALLIIGKTAALYWTIFSLLWMWAFGIIELNGISLPVEYNPAMRSMWYLSIVPGLLLIIMVVSFTFENSMQTAMRDVEQQKVTIEKQSIELAKLIEDKDHIIEILAHDLKNPLANIGVLANLLERETIEPDSKNIVEMIANASANAQVLVKQVLEMATTNSVGSVLLKATNFQSVINEVVQSFRFTAENKGIPIKTVDLNKSCEALANLTYLKLVLENLISNAIKFSTSGKEIHVLVSETDQQVQIRVRDHGPGVPAAEEAKLFKKFSKLSVAPTGGESSSGLGLSLVKRYMEIMKGSVWFERPEGSGSIFAIELTKA
ncbi:MAG: HAMP domain-containing histidine kinase [Bacteroidetes bacterium]|nr:HAMP domain-containing histidine kinase [Bacteroidota bacterium]